MNNPNNPDESRSGDENRPYDLMDGATGESLQVIRELEEQRKISADLNMPLDERLEAYEDIFDSQVGDTSLVRARNIERQVGLRQIFLKFEGGNPTGTQKDRIAFAQAMDALRRGFDTITLATCGNYGVAIALAASFAGLKCRICIPSFSLVLKMVLNQIVTPKYLTVVCINSNQVFCGLNKYNLSSVMFYHCR